MSGYVKIFKDKGGDKYNKSISWHIYDDKIFNKYKTIWTKLEVVLSIEWDPLPFHDDRYIKPKVGAYVDEVYTDFQGLNALENGVKYESFIGIYIESLLVHDKNFLCIYI